MKIHTASFFNLLFLLRRKIIFWIHGEQKPVLFQILKPSIIIFANGIKKKAFSTKNVTGHKTIDYGILFNNL